VLYISVIENIINPMLVCSYLDTAVKKKVHNLRTAYAREKYVIEKCRSMDGKPNPVKLKKRWRHYDKLRFLDEVFSPKSWFLQVSFYDVWLYNL